jgi:hypothetical protein
MILRKRRSMVVKRPQMRTLRIITQLMLKKPAKELKQSAKLRSKLKLQLRLKK